MKPLFKQVDSLKQTGLSITNIARRLIHHIVIQHIRVKGKIRYIIVDVKSDEILHFSMFHYMSKARASQNRLLVKALEEKYAYSKLIHMIHNKP